MEHGRDEKASHSYGVVGALLDGASARGEVGRAIEWVQGEGGGAEDRRVASAEKDAGSRRTLGSVYETQITARNRWRCRRKTEEDARVR